MELDLPTPVSNPMQLHALPTPKNMFASIKIDSKNWHIVHENDVQFGNNAIQRWRIAN